MTDAHSTPNPAAFPAPQFAVPGDASRELVLLLKASQGMSLRDYFAAKAMHAALTHQAVGEIEGWIESCAKYAYIAADAMLVARGKS
jgi:hypothetical protein